jgi:hypothetical protein
MAFDQFSTGIIVSGWAVSSNVPVVHYVSTRFISIAKLKKFNDAFFCHLVAPQKIKPGQHKTHQGNGSPVGLLIG